VHASVFKELVVAALQESVMDLIFPGRKLYLMNWLDVLKGASCVKVNPPNLVELREAFRVPQCVSRFRSTPQVQSMY